MLRRDSYLREQLNHRIGSISGFADFTRFALFLGLAGCAGQVYPSGGERDLIPPAIERTIPDTNAVRVATDRIVILFSKYVDRRSVEESVFLSPTLGELEYEWAGREVTILFRQALKEQTTYVVTLGTDIIDLRERNRMAAGFTLAFSTGDSLDRGEIAGRVVDHRPEGVMIFAYRLDRLFPDTLDPGHTKPDFIMQTGTGGRFLLSNLPLDTYRLFAVRDEYRNFQYDREVDGIGMTAGDVRLTPGRSRVGGILFRLTREDTTAPFIASASAGNRRRIDVRFSEPVDSLRWPPEPFVVTDTLSGARVAVARAFWKSAQPPTAGLVLAADLDSTRMYRVTADGLRDRTGHPINPALRSALLSGSGVPDTLRPSVSIEGMRDSIRGIPVDASIVVQFDEPVLPERVIRGVSLLDSLRRPVPLAARWEGDTRLRLTPSAPLATFAWYRCRVILDSVVTFREPRYLDSALVVRFQTLDPRGTGDVKGLLVDRNGGGHRYLLTVEPLDAPPATPRTLFLPSPGPFHLTLLPGGRYSFSVFEDADSSGTYSAGQPFPFKGAERFTLSSDTVKVRARWGVEGVRVAFP